MVTQISKCNNGTGGLGINILVQSQYGEHTDPVAFLTGQTLHTTAELQY